MDLSMPGLGGIENTRRLMAQAPECRVLVLTVSQEENIMNAVLAGASGFVLKDGPIEDVVEGIDSVAAGEPYLSERVAAELLRHLRRSGEKSSPLNRMQPASPPPNVAKLRTVKHAPSAVRTRLRAGLTPIT